MVVVACNSASSTSLPTLQAMFRIPIVGVIEPGAKAGTKATRNKRIGVIGTNATIRSQAYQKKITEIMPEANVYAKPCPLFVPLAEEGWLNHPATRIIAEEYLTPLKEEGIDTLVLGCTHYPLLMDTIQDVMGEDVTLVEPGRETAKAIKAVLEEKGWLREGEPISPEFYLTDIPANFATIGTRFLRRPLPTIEKVNITPA